MKTLLSYTILDMALKDESELAWGLHFITGNPYVRVK